MLDVMRPDTPTTDLRAEPNRRWGRAQAHPQQSPSMAWQVKRYTLACWGRRASDESTPGTHRRQRSKLCVDPACEVELVPYENTRDYRLMRMRTVEAHICGDRSVQGDIQ